MDSLTIPDLQWFANTGSGVWAVDETQHIVFWNQAAQELLGYTADQALGSSCHSLLAGQDVQGNPSCRDHCRLVQSARQEEPIPGFEMLAVCQDGRSLHIGVSIIVLPAPSGLNKSTVLVHIFRPLQAPTAPSSLRVHLLGRTDVWRTDGSLVEGASWRKRKVRVLLAFLAIQYGQPAHRQTLIEALWPDLEYDAALRSLNTTVYHLRRSLEPTIQQGADSHHVRYEGNCYWLDGGSSPWVDVQAFETGIAQARLESNPDQAITLYRRAQSLYQGELVADLGATTAWCFGERERLHDLYLNALEETGSLYERRLDFFQAAEMYWRVVSADHCRESAYQRLMRLAAMRGDRATVAVLYHRLSAALASEVEAHPAQETLQIYEAARRGF